MKKVFLLLVIVGAAFALFFRSAPNAGHTAGESVSLHTAATNTPVITCLVSAGIDDGRVNLRSCAGTDCGVKTILSSGQTLTVIARGEWLKVATADNLTGYIKSKFCK